MISASELRNMIEEQNKSKEEIPILKQIEEFILDAANNGRYSIYGNGFIPDNEVKILRELGYEVTRYNHCGMDEFDIRWQ